MSHYCLKIQQNFRAMLCIIMLASGDEQRMLIYMILGLILIIIIVYFIGYLLTQRKQHEFSVLAPYSSVNVLVKSLTSAIHNICLLYQWMILL